jgi:ADP-ribosylglycohydrolase
MPEDQIYSDGTASIDRYRGAMLGLAIGDALGAPVRDLSLAGIQAAHGLRGVRDYLHWSGSGRTGGLSAETQMALFAADGIIRAHLRSIDKGICGVASVMHHAMLRWVRLQGFNSWHELFGYDHDGWLVSLPALHCRRAPPTPVLCALARQEMGTVEKPPNDYCGASGVVRSVPLGLAFDENLALGKAAEILASTHGHASGYLAAGALAGIVAHVVAGTELRAAVDAVIGELRECAGHQEVVDAIAEAVQYSSYAPCSPGFVDRIGDGWTAPSALGRALFCCMTASSFEQGVIAAINHGGDSAACGAIAGAVLGLIRVEAAIPRRWLDDLELRAEIGTLAADLHRHFVEYEANSDECALVDGDWTRYPGW